MKTNKRKTKQRYTIKKGKWKIKKIQSGGRYIPPLASTLPPIPDRYNMLLTLYETLTDEYNNLVNENESLENKNKILIAEKPEYVSAFEQTKEMYNKLFVAHEGLIRDLNAEVDAGVELRKFNIKLKKDNAALKTIYDELQRSCAELQIKYDKLLRAGSKEEK